MDHVDFRLGFVGLLALIALGGCEKQSPAQDSALLDDIVALRQQGEDYAQANCSACHATARSDLRSPSPRAPSFVVIGSTPGMTLMALNAALHSPHATMPNLKVEQAAVEPLSAYISSLKDPAVTQRLRDEANKAEKVLPLDGRQAP
jgi:mono/diheme cytochrome c family protein